MEKLEYNGYTVFEDGRIYSNKLRNGFLKPWLNKGYPYVKIDGKSMAVHRVVSTVFMGEKPNGYTVNHIDGNKKNNHVSNLEYISNEENYNHALSLGLKRNISYYLTIDEASDMVEFYFNTSYSMKEICSWFGFHRIVLRNLIEGNSNNLWRWTG